MTTSPNELAFHSACGWHIENSYATLPNIFFAHQHAAPIEQPSLVIFNEALALQLGLNPHALEPDKWAQFFSGNVTPVEAKPLAQAYAGHQFGHFTMLGDGRALLIGEQITPNGERFDIQLKGSGRTPFSRRGDGLAALGPMLREYIISEAMHALGIPTTRSLAVVETGEPVYRENELPGAILTRVASSHLRVGTFQYAAQYAMQQEDSAIVRALTDYAIARHDSELLQIEAVLPEQRYLLFLKRVISRQAKLIAKWQCVGFIHGVMNTDNMSICGETIDYGPCAFMDRYDPETVFSSIDSQGRYAYCNQPYIGGWNLARFAESLLLILHDDPQQAIPIAQTAMSEYNDLYHQAWLDGMRQKFGIFPMEESNEQLTPKQLTQKHQNDQVDQALIEAFLEMMHQNRADFTNTFRMLSTNAIEQSAIACHAAFFEWHQKWQARLAQQQRTHDEVLQLMQAHNPVVIPRNHRVEEALSAAVNQGNFQVMEQLLAALKNPFVAEGIDPKYMELPSEGGEHYQTFCGT